MSRKIRPLLTRSLVLSALIAGASVLALTYSPGQSYAAEDDFTDPDPTPAAPPQANSETVESVLKKLIRDAPDYQKTIIPYLLKQPLPAKIFDQGGIPAFLPRHEIDKDPNGTIGTYNLNGVTITSQNAFFKSFGNGRACVTCH